ncbi:MAG: flavin reductase family protein [Dokdonella sp.]|uniref:flavin reductase family protein n=1 Tax=Dokdonella sp. TaxID=2291710 RepID=UPI0032641A56
MTMESRFPPVDPRVFRDVMGRFATGVTVVSFIREGSPAGMTVNAFMSVSMAPPLVLVSVRREASFNAFVKVGDRYGVNVLSEAQQHLSAYFSSRPVEGVSVPFKDCGGTPLLEGSLAQVVARVVDIHEAGDHLLHIGEVEHLWHGAEATPLIFFTGKYKHIDAHEPTVQWNAVDGW